MVTTTQEIRSKGNEWVSCVRNGEVSGVHQKRARAHTPATFFCTLAPRTVSDRKSLDARPLALSKQTATEHAYVQRKKGINTNATSCRMLA